MDYNLTWDLHHIWQKQKRKQNQKTKPHTHKKTKNQQPIQKTVPDPIYK